MLKRLIKKNKYIFSIAKFFHSKFLVIIIFSIYIAKKLKLKKNINKIKNTQVNVITWNLNTGLGSVALSLFKVLKVFHKTNVIFLQKKIKVSQYASNNLLINILIGNPEFFYHHQVIGKLNLINSYIIGFWFWELEDIPKRWLNSYGLIDEVWVCTNFMEKQLRELANKVVKIPFFVDIQSFSLKNKSELKVPRDKFIFLFSFDFLSYYHRKNPEGLVQAFLEAFENDSSVLLIIKSRNGKYQKKYMNRLLNMINSHQNIEFRDINYTRDENLSLIKHCDCFVSLHRAEGLGLHLAEAMALSKPVIATNYSGNLEYMNKNNSLLIDYELLPVGDRYAFSTKSYWAEPNIKHAAKLMRLIYSNKKLRKQLSHSAQKDLKSNTKPFFEKFIHNYFAESTFLK